MPEISKTVDQALRLLQHIGAQGATSPTDAARSLKMHRTVVHRALATLLQRGFVRRTEAGYKPGLALLWLSAKVEPELLAAARPVLEHLAATYGETFILTVPDGTAAVQIDQVVGSKHFVRVELVRGFTHALAKGASGRAILAFQPPEQWAEAARTAPDAGALPAALKRVKRNGYAVSHDELSQGVYGLSVPLFAGRLVAGSIGIVVPSSRTAALEDMPRILTQASSKIARAMKG